MCDWTKRQWCWIIHIDIRGNNRTKYQHVINYCFWVPPDQQQQKKWSWIEPFKFQFKTIDFVFKVERCPSVYYYRFLRWKNKITNLLLLSFYSSPIDPSRREFFSINELNLSETVISTKPIIKVNNCINVEFMMFRLWKIMKSLARNNHKYWNSSTLL